MGEVIAFQKEKVRKTTLRGDARKLMTECFDRVPKPLGVVIVVVGDNGTMSIRFSSAEPLRTFDLLARAEAMAEFEKMDLLAEPGAAGEAVEDE